MFSKVMCNVTTILLCRLCYSEILQFFGKLFKKQMQKPRKIRGTSTNQLRIYTLYITYFMKLYKSIIKIVKLENGGIKSTQAKG